MAFTDQSSTDQSFADHQKLMLEQIPKTILIVDDLSEDQAVLSEVLKQRGYTVLFAMTGFLGLEQAIHHSPDLILLDISLPDINGYDICQQLKSLAQTRDIPVIFISALDDVLDKVRAFEVGGADYVTKPFQLEELIVRINHQLRLQEATLEIQRLNVALEQRVRERTAELEAVNGNLLTEIAERKRVEDRLIHETLHDALTGLPNRSLFIERVDNCLRYSQRYADYRFAVLFLDLDRFKIINDSLGHLVGDRLLVAIAHILSDCLRGIDTVARLGGDEFIILLEQLRDEGDAIRVAERVQAALKAPIDLNDHRVFMSASIGIAIGSNSYNSREDVLRDADIAMYRAKEAGRARYAIFDQKMYLRTLNLLRIESDLRHALDRHEFLLYYQPVVSLVSGELAGFEALVRWQHPQKGFVSPVEFIPIAEDTGLIVPLGEWVLREACRQMREWQNRFPLAQKLRMSVNLAGKQLQEPNLIHRIDKILADTGLNGSALRLELTESMLMERTGAMIELMKSIRDRSIQLSIDDFGTGYSSLSYLHRFPVNSLKIDRSFVSNMNTDSENFEIVRTVITLAHTLAMDVIAEGVEIPEQSQQLRQLGCEFSQGYLFSKPLNAEAATALIREQMQWPLPQIEVSSPNSLSNSLPLDSAGSRN